MINQMPQVAFKIVLDTESTEKCNPILFTLW